MNSSLQSDRGEFRSFSSGFCLPTVTHACCSLLVVLLFALQEESVGRGQAAVQLEMLLTFLKNDSQTAQSQQDQYEQHDHDQEEIEQPKETPRKTPKSSKKSKADR